MFFSMPTWLILMVGVLAVVILVLVLAGIAQLTKHRRDDDEPKDDEPKSNPTIETETTTVKPTDFSSRTVGMMPSAPIPEPVSEPEPAAEEVPPPVFSEEESAAEVELPKKAWRCPKCGKFVAHTVSSCPRDGTIFGQ